MKLQALILKTLIVLTMSLLVACESDPPTPENEKFLGAFNITQTGDVDFDGRVDNSNYTLTISESSVSQKRIILSNLGGFGNVTVDAEINGSAFTIPQQSIDLTTFVLGVSGSGSVTESTITYSFQFSLGGNTYDYSCTGTKR